MQSTLGTAARRPSLKIASARALYGLVTVFLLFDAIAKLVMAPGVADGFHRLGMAISLAPVVATILLVMTVLYVVPRTSAFGAVLLTGYLGGAFACTLRAGVGTFETFFPVLFGIVMWAPVYVLNDDVRALLPLRRVRRNGAGR